MTLSFELICKNMYLYTLWNIFLGLEIWEWLSVSILFRILFRYLVLRTCTLIETIVLLSDPVEMRVDYHLWIWGCIVRTLPEEEVDKLWTIQGVVWVRTLPHKIIMHQEIFILLMVTQIWTMYIKWVGINEIFGLWPVFDWLRCTLTTGSILSDTTSIKHSSNVCWICSILSRACVPIACLVMLFLPVTILILFVDRALQSLQALQSNWWTPTSTTLSFCR